MGNSFQDTHPYLHPTYMHAYVCKSVYACKNVHTWILRSAGRGGAVCRLHSQTPMAMMPCSVGVIAHAEGSSQQLAKAIGAALAAPTRQAAVGSVVGLLTLADSLSRVDMTRLRADQQIHAAAARIHWVWHLGFSHFSMNWVGCYESGSIFESRRRKLFPPPPPRI